MESRLFTGIISPETSAFKPMKLGFKGELKRWLL